MCTDSEQLILRRDTVRNSAPSFGDVALVPWHEATHLGTVIAHVLVLLRRHPVVNPRTSRRGQQARALSDSLLRTADDASEPRRDVRAALHEWWTVKVVGAATGHWAGHHVGKRPVS